MNTYQYFVLPAPAAMTASICFGNDSKSFSRYFAETCHQTFLAIFFSPAIEDVSFRTTSFHRILKMISVLESSKKGLLTEINLVFLRPFI